LSPFRWRGIDAEYAFLIVIGNSNHARHRALDYQAILKNQSSITGRSRSFSRLHGIGIELRRRELLDAHHIDTRKSLVHRGVPSKTLMRSVGHDWLYLLTIATFAIVLRMRVNPLYLIASSALAGMVRFV